jgi:hypothetical protein
LSNSGKRLKVKGYRRKGGKEERGKELQKTKDRRKRVL